MAVADLNHPSRPAEPLPASLVIDASGRGSRLVECLATHGCAVPPVERRRIDGRYVTRRFTRPAGQAPPDGLATWDGVVSGTPSPRHRSAALIRVAERAWLLSLAGYDGLRPPPDLPAFLAYAADAGGPAADLVSRLEPSGAPLNGREPALIRRRFELVDHPRMVVVGDALCTLDAVSGAGMSVAAVEATTLAELLTEGAGAVSRGYYRRTRPLLDRLWGDAVERHGLG